MTEDEIFFNKSFDEQFFTTNNKIKLKILNEKDNKEPTTNKQSKHSF